MGPELGDRNGEHQLHARQLASDIADLIAKNGEQHTGVIIAALATVTLQLVSMTGNDLRELRQAIELRDGTA